MPTYFKKHSWRVVIIVALFFSISGVVRAQVAVTNPPAGSGISGDASMCSMNSAPDSTGQTENVGVLVDSAGDIPAITGSYTGSVECSNYVSSACGAVTDAFTAATAEGNSISDMPTYTPSADLFGSGNSVNINVDSDMATQNCGAGVGACEFSTIVTNPDLTTSVVSNIYIDPNVPSIDLIIQNPAQLKCDIEHEMSHGFGADEGYPNPDTTKINSPGIMGNECYSDTPPSWSTDPLLTNMIGNINNAGVSGIPVTLPSSDSCSSLTCFFDPTQQGCGCSDTQLAAGGINNTSSGGGCIMSISEPVIPTSTTDINSSSTTSSSTDTNSSSTDINSSSTDTTMSSCPSGAAANSSGGCTCADGSAPDAATGCTESTLNCQSNPADSDCMAYCENNVDSDACNTQGATYCLQNPTDSDCMAYCQDNQSDPACTGTNSTNDPAYCALNLTDPACSGSGGTSGSFGGGGGSASGPGIGTGNGSKCTVNNLLSAGSNAYCGLTGSWSTGGGGGNGACDDTVNFSPTSNIGQCMPIKQN